MRSSALKFHRFLLNFKVIVEFSANCFPSIGSFHSVHTLIHGQ